MGAVLMDRLKRLIALRDVEKAKARIASANAAFSCATAMAHSERLAQLIDGTRADLGACAFQQLAASGSLRLLLQSAEAEAVNRAEVAFADRRIAEQRFLEADARRESLQSRQDEEAKCRQAEAERRMADDQPFRNARRP